MIEVFLTTLAAFAAIIVGVLVGVGVASGLFWLTLKLPEKFQKWLGL